MTDNWQEITDPEELFKLKREGWEIEYLDGEVVGWASWEGKDWHSSFDFRARPRQPKMKKVKLLAWLGKTNFNMVREDVHDVIGYYEKAKDWNRQPHLDLEAEVPDEQ